MTITTKQVVKFTTNRNEKRCWNITNYLLVINYTHEVNMYRLDLVDEASNRIVKSCVDVLEYSVEYTN